MASTFGNPSVPVGPTSGGKTYAFNNIGTAPSVVAPSNTPRNSITFHNPGSVNIYVAPVNVQAIDSIPATGIINQPLTPSPSALGGCLLVFANGGQITLTGECSGAFQAFAATGSTNALTVIESNV